MRKAAETKTKAANKKEKVVDIPKQPKKAEKEVSEAVKQAYRILDIFEGEMDYKQKEAFLLGRIYTLLEFGDMMTQAANHEIRRTEVLLQNVQRDISETEIKKPVARKATTKKETKKNEK